MSGKRFPGTTDRPRSRIARRRAGTRLDERGGAGLALEHGRAQLGEVVARERALAVERLVQRDAEAELVGARIDGLSAQLLGRHVERRAEDRPDAREARRLRAVQRLPERGEAEVHDAHGAVAP